MKRTLFAAVAAAALLAAMFSAGPAAQPVSAQSDTQSEPGATAVAVTCADVVTSTRVIREVRDAHEENQVTARLIEQTVVNRCTSTDGTTHDENPRTSRFWQYLS